MTKPKRDQKFPCVVSEDPLIIDDGKYGLVYVTSSVDPAAYKRSEEIRKKVEDETRDQYDALKIRLRDALGKTSKRAL